MQVLNMNDDAMSIINWRAGFSFRFLVVLLVGTYADNKAHACNINDDGDGDYNWLARRFFFVSRFFS